ncbi:exported hypothetical protein [Tenacibaculum litopenaei]|uniref:T9SS type A sorting domain-containing protein n=1 Tax=Tenacibaculum litopenaei TaxID=396016 RepID=UPI00389342C7
MRTKGAILLLLLTLLLSFQDLRGQNSGNCPQVGPVVVSGEVSSINFSECDVDLEITTNGKHTIVEGEIYVNLKNGHSIRFIPKNGHQIRIIPYLSRQMMPGSKTTVGGTKNEEESLPNGDAGKKTRLYPNPVRETLNIDSKEQLNSYKIINLQGVTLQEGKLNSNSISVSQLPIGIYRIVFSTPTGIITKKIVKN